MTETAHTPLPWAIDKYGAVLHDGQTVVTEGFALGGSTLAKQNAALIVQAVNSHHRLVEAANGVMDILGRAESNASGNPEFDYVGPRVAAFRAALKEVNQ